MLDLYLLGKDLLSNFLSVLPDVGSVAQDQLKHDDTQGVVIYSYSVILSAHNFGGHIPRGSTRILSILWFPDASDAQISHMKIACMLPGWFTLVHRRLDSLA